MADDDYVDGGVVEIVPVTRRGGHRGRRGSSPWLRCPSGWPETSTIHAAAPLGYIGLRSMGMIGVAERQISNLNVALPTGTTLTTIDPIVDVVGLFEVEPGLLRINRDYGWLRAADVLAESDAGIRADMADATHAIVEARREAWRLEEALWGRARIDEVDPGTMALVREHKERVRELVDRRKQLGFPVPDGCDAWWLDYETHTAERPGGLPSTPSPSDRGG